MPEDVSLDPTFDFYGQEADAYMDALLGNGAPLEVAPTIIKHASSTYAAGRYLLRVKEDSRGKILMDDAEKMIMAYKKGQGTVTVFG